MDTFEELDVNAYREKQLADEVFKWIILEYVPHEDRDEALDSLKSIFDPHDMDDWSIAEEITEYEENR